MSMEQPEKANLDILPEDLLLIIWKYLSTNKEVIALYRTCKYFKEIGDRSGYLRHLRLNLDSDIRNWHSLQGKHTGSVVSLSVNRMIRPIPWIPGKWPKNY